MRKIQAEFRESVHRFILKLFVYLKSERSHFFKNELSNSCDKSESSG